MINIITFNILSSELIFDTVYPVTDPKYLDKHYRLDKFKIMLNEYVNQNFIICLQEVSSEWNIQLKEYFTLLNYNWTYVPHVKKNSKLGVSICYPTSLYEATSIFSTRIGDVIGKSTADLKEQFGSETSSELIKEIYANIAEAEADRATLLIHTITVKQNNKILHIATYHMPCKYTKPIVMEAHVLCCMKIVNEIANDDPVIFVGDFNSKHGGNEWVLLTKGQPIGDLSKEMIKKYPVCGKCFEDANSTVNNGDTTCFNQVTNETFKIDFIFYRNLKCVKSSIVTATFPIPSADHISDHVPILASFEI